MNRSYTSGKKVSWLGSLSASLSVLLSLLLLQPVSLLVLSSALQAVSQSPPVQEFLLLLLLFAST